MSVEGGGRGLELGERLAGELCERLVAGWVGPLGEAAGEEFNILLGKGMTHTSKPLTATGLPTQCSSTIYSWMRGWVWAFDHPYFGVTDANGRYVIPNAPAGKANRSSELLCRPSASRIASIAIGQRPGSVAQS